MAAGTSAPFFPLLKTKEQWIPPTQARVREVLPTASREAAGGKPREGAEAAPAGPAPGSLFSGQEGGLLPTRRLQRAPSHP